MAHQWLIRPEAIALRPYTERKVLYGYPDCPGAADYAVSFPFQDPVLYCTQHAARSIRRAMGRRVGLEGLVKATRAREGKVRRSWTHVHWPLLERADEMGEEVDSHEVHRRDEGVCGAYVLVRFMARERGEVTCPRCQKRLARSPRPPRHAPASLWP